MHHDRECSKRAHPGVIYRYPFATILQSLFFPQKHSDQFIDFLVPVPVS